MISHTHRALKLAIKGNIFQKDIEKSVHSSRASENYALAKGPEYPHHGPYLPNPFPSYSYRSHTFYYVGTADPAGYTEALKPHKNMGVVLKVLVKKGPLGIHFLKRGSEPNREPTLWPFWGRVF